MTNDTPATSDIDPVRLRQAVDAGNIPSLIAVAYQLTGDSRWLTDRYRPTRSRGMDDNQSGGLPADVQAEIRAGVVEAVLGDPSNSHSQADLLDNDQLMNVVEFVMGESVPKEFGPMLSEVMGLTSGEPRRPSSPGDAKLSAIVIGAGIAGMLASVRLSEAGIDHIVLEKNQGVGGSWYENTYPGAGVDTPSYLYSYSFFDHNWSTHFGKRDEVQAYLEDFAQEYELARNIRFGVEVTRTEYDSDRQTWTAHTVDALGRQESIEANILISAVGVLNRPKVPDLPGLDSFSGTLFHSAEWPDGIDLTGKKVAIVGAGASAMQIGPAVVDDVSSLTIYQRSPQWIASNSDYFAEVGDDVHWLIENVPFYAAWYRARLSWIFNDKVHESLQIDPEWPEEKASINVINHAHRRVYERYIRGELEGHPELVEKCLPDYPPFGKRMLLDNGWYRMLTRDHVDLVTEGVTAATPSGLRDTAGEERDFDVIIMATGFHTDRVLYPMDIIGNRAMTTREIWGDHDARAYLGITVPSFPNMFIMTGPNTALGHGGSFITILECQIRYIMDAIAHMVDDGISSLECRDDVNTEYNNAVDEAHARMVWTHPAMDNWYRNKDGRVVAVLPWRIVDYWRMTHEINLDDFITEKSQPLQLQGTLVDR